MNTAFVTKIGKRGTFVIPFEIREQLSLKEGDLLISEINEDGLMLKPAIALPIETYSLERKAEFILSNSISKKDYEASKEAVKAMGLDPNKIKHYSSYKNNG